MRIKGARTIPYFPGVHVVFEDQLICLHYFFSLNYMIFHGLEREACFMNHTDVALRGVRRSVSGSTSIRRDRWAGLMHLRKRCPSNRSKNASQRTKAGQQQPMRCLKQLRPVQPTNCVHIYIDIMVPTENRIYLPLGFGS